MDLKNDVVKPIATGTAVTVVTLAIQWVLQLVGFAPVTLLTVNAVITIQGVVGIFASLWGVGYVLPKIPHIVEVLMKSV